MSYLLENRTILFTLSLFLLFLSCLGPEGVPFKQYLFSNKIDELYKVFIQSDSYFRTPNSPLRLTLFILSFYIMFESLRIPTSSNLKLSKLTIKIINYLICFFLITNLVTNNGSNIAFISLLFISLFYLLFIKNNEVNEYYQIETLLLSTMILMFFVAIFSSIYHDTSLKEIDNYSRFVLFVPIYLLLRDVKIDYNMIYLFINNTSIITGLIALYYFIIHGENRVAVYSSSTIIYGNISLLFMIFSYLTIKPLKDSSKSLILPITATMLAFIAWSLTGTRGSLLGLLIILLLFFGKKYRDLIYIPNLKIASIFLVFIGIIFSQTNNFNRIVEGYNSGYNYIMHNEETSWKNTDSIMPRLIIWKGSYNIAKDNFIFGVGLDKFNIKLLEQIRERKIPMIRKDFNNPTGGLNHAHNQYLDITAKVGVLGFITLILFLLINLMFFHRRLRSESIQTQNIALFGMVTVVMYASHMVTHAVLSHHHSTVFMLMMLMLFFSSIVNLDKKGI